jgi:hypothetical protein
MKPSAFAAPLLLIGIGVYGLDHRAHVGAPEIRALDRADANIPNGPLSGVELCLVHSDMSHMSDPCTGATVRLPLVPYPVLTGPPPEVSNCPTTRYRKSGDTIRN